MTRSEVLVPCMHGWYGGAVPLARTQRMGFFASPRRPPKKAFTARGQNVYKFVNVKVVSVGCSSRSWVERPVEDYI